MSLQALTVCSTMALSTCGSTATKQGPPAYAFHPQGKGAATPEAHGPEGLFAFRDRQSALADGPAWAALKKHRRPILRRGTSCRGATPDTAGGGFNSGAWGRLKAARPDTVQVNLPLPLHSFNGVGGGFVVNLLSGPYADSKIQL